MAGQHIDSENAGMPSWQAAVETTLPAAEPAASISSYESYLRVKNGVSDSVLVTAGLPPAGELSYAAYMAAFGAKARPPHRAARAVGAQAAKTWTSTFGLLREAMRGKRNVLIMAGTGTALLSAFFIGAAVDTHILGGDQPGIAEAQAIPRSSGPIVLVVTQADELLTMPILSDLEQITPLPTISVPNFTPLAEPSIPGEMDAEISPPAKVSKKISKSVEDGAGEMRATPAKVAAAKVTKQSAKPAAPSAPKKVSAKGTKAVGAETEVLPPLRWLDQVFEGLSDSLGGTETSAKGSTPRKTPAGGDRETKR
nr:hypothetical protein [uncultured Dongia sp.]